MVTDREVSIFLFGFGLPFILAGFAVAVHLLWDVFLDSRMVRHMRPLLQLTEEDLAYSKEKCPEAKWYRHGRLVIAVAQGRIELALTKKGKRNG